VSVDSSVDENNQRPIPVRSIVIQQRRPRGAVTKRQVRNFVRSKVPIVKFQVQKENVDLVEGDDALHSCGICLCPFEDGEDLKALNCNSAENQDGSSLVEAPSHMFHQECITQWFFKKLECPMCRKCFKDELMASVNDPEERKSENDQQHSGDDDVIDLNDGAVSN
jgi:hypothetical protein